MLFRALAAFVALPGLVAFAIPLTIGISTDRPMRHQMLAAMPLCFGTILLLWCAREFYLRVILFEEPWAARQFGAEWQAYRTKVSRWI